MVTTVLVTVTKLLVTVLVIWTDGSRFYDVVDQQKQKPVISRRFIAILRALFSR